MNPSLETWGVPNACEINVTPDSWINYSNGGLAMDEANFSLCPTTIPPNASDSNVYGRAVAYGNTGEGIYQIVSGFIPGNTYQFSFDYAGSNLYGGLEPVQWYLFIDDIDSFSTPVFQSTETVWASYQYTFVATLATHKIGFRLHNAPTYSSGSGAIDNLELTQNNTPVSAFAAADNSICPGTCIYFTNLSLYADSCQWIFTGANPSTDTSFNPSNICYPNPGNYAVTLITFNTNGSDTLSYPNYLTVFPSPPPQGITQNGDTLFANTGATSYQWYHNGNLITGATNYYYIATEDGDYNVVATDINNCEVEAVIYDVIAGFTPAPPMEEGGVMVFPNPVEDQFTILYSKFKIYIRTEILIYNLFGEMVLTVSPLSFGEGYGGEADCRLLSPGIYWIEINDLDKTYRAKFIKK